MRLFGPVFLTLLVSILSANAENREQRGILPWTNHLLKWTRDRVVEIPQEIASQVIEFLCGSIISNIISPMYRVDPSEVECYMKKNNRNISFTLANPHVINRDLESNSVLTIFVSGFPSDLSTNGVRAIQEAYECRGEQFLHIALGEHIRNLRTWALLDTESLGKVLGEAIFSMTSKVPADNIHLIGHSVGAHVAGAAGRRFFQLSGTPIPRITGLDAALPCYKETAKQKTLHHGDGLFVEAYHTSLRALGIGHSIGDVDFYINGKGTLEPGCSGVVCAHNRAMYYFAESVYPGNEYAFMARKCAESGQSFGQEPMGLVTPSNLKGDYCLSTADAPPFGLNRTSSQPVRCSEPV